MALRVLIVDDEPIARRTLEKLITAAGDLELVGQCRHGEEAVQAIAERRPDLVFLDVEMRNLSGFEVIERIGAEHMPLVIFVTAFDRYALQAFDVNAVDYLLKPFDEGRFRTALDRARQRLSGGLTPVLRRVIGESLRAAVADAYNGGATAPLKRIAANRDGRLVFVDTADIQCIEARGNYVVLHAGQGSYLMRATLQQILAMLEGAEFLRIHRSIVVNGAHVREMERQPSGEYALTLANGQKYTSSVGYRQGVLDYIRHARP